MRCAIVPPTPVPYREPLFRALSERPDLDVCVIYQSAGQRSWDVPADWFPSRHPYPALHLRSWQRRRAGRTPLVSPRGLVRALRDVDPDCVVVWEYGAASLQTLAWCRRHRRAYVIFTECTPQIDSMLPRWQLGLHRRLARHADAVIAASSAARRRLLAFGVPGERIHVALQAADLERFRAVAPARGDVCRVLSVGRLVPDKNFATLIRAVPADAELEIVGTGFLEEELKRLADDQAARVSFRGHVSPEELPALYAAADVYALISTYEPFGVAVREAAAAGLPIVCSRAAGAAGDVAVDGRNAILVDPENADEIAAALARLTSDPELRAHMGAESRAIDRETDGVEVDAFIEAMTAAYSPRRAGSTSPRSRATEASGR
ncbi:MAG TPA: glycosyltransferase family 4 protein [Solirubrobacteraceae bacterium]|nr:glycosyltransferase family 4 protein [Solirubrobacteraceae bacterium]